MSEDQAHYKAMPPCAFDNATHTYTIAGRPVISVTQAINLSLGPPEHGSDWHMERGTEIHAAAAHIMRGRIPIVDERIQARVDAVRKFQAHEVSHIHEVERPVYSVRMRYAGTLDAIVTLGMMDKRVIVDWKSSGTILRTGIQMSGYAMAWQEMTGEIITHGVMVLLGDDGRYKAETVKLSDYVNKWRACLTVAGMKWNGQTKGNDDAKNDTCM